MKRLIGRTFNNGAKVSGLYSKKLPNYGLYDPYKFREAIFHLGGTAFTKASSFSKDPNKYAAYNDGGGDKSEFVEELKEMR
jgi:hypothetical protein